MNNKPYVSNIDPNKKESCGDYDIILCETIYDKNGKPLPPLSAVSTAMVGIASKKIGKQFHCKNCGYDFKKSFIESHTFSNICPLYVLEFHQYVPIVLLRKKSQRIHEYLSYMLLVIAVEAFRFLSLDHYSPTMF